MPDTAYIALGANLGDRAANLRAALDQLNATSGVRVVAASSFLENPSIGGPPDAPPFLNAVAAVETSLEPVDLLDRLLEIERQMGRVRERQNDPRPIDLDILLFSDRIVVSPKLTIPHPRMHERLFVLQPLAEIAPDVVHPALRRSVREMLRTGVRELGMDKWGMGNEGRSEANVTSNAPLLPHSSIPHSPLSASPALRRATNADGPAIRELVFGVLREYGLAPDPADTDADLADIEASYHARGGRFDVLEADGRIVGTVGLYPHEPGVVELRKMYLSRDVRGRGFGRKLLEHAVAAAREMGAKRMILETASVLREAVAMYRKFGFQPCTLEHVASRCDQTMGMDLA